MQRSRSRDLLQRSPLSLSLTNLHAYYTSPPSCGLLHHSASVLGACTPVSSLCASVRPQHRPVCQSAHCAVWLSVLPVSGHRASRYDLAASLLPTCSCLAGPSARSIPRITALRTPAKRGSSFHLSVVINLRAFRRHPANPASSLLPCFSVLPSGYSSALPLSSQYSGDLRAVL